ncbi:hypothetical protein ACHAWC_007723 [Mediolabrus comicus]
MTSSSPMPTHSRKSKSASSGAGGGGSSSSSLPYINASSDSASHLTSTLTPQLYLQRMTDLQQMDLQSAIDQMRILLTLYPQRVYKMAYYRKQTKNHWARDDPAFCFLQIIMIAAVSIAYGFAFRVGSILDMIGVVTKSVLVNWLGLGIIIASVGRLIANNHLMMAERSSSHVKQEVEWLYAFDVHCNAFVPLFVLLYGVQLFLLPVVLGPSLLSLGVSNTLFALAFGWYFYITHLGYRALPFLSNTEVFLFPIAAVLVLYVFNYVGYPFGLGFNASRVMAFIYFES